MSRRTSTSLVTDPFDVASDPAMPFMARALDPESVEHEFERIYPGSALDVRAIRVLRHKPGRRCLVEYDVSGIDGLVLGKARARSLDTRALKTTTALWKSGFGPDARDSIMVPEPLGAIPAFQMWLQRKVPGVVTTGVLASSSGRDLATRVAEAARKLHQSGVPTTRQHGPAEEMVILERRLHEVIAEEPRFSARVERVLAGCAQLAARLPDDRTTGIHRDFYPDQVLVDERDLYLLDLDLYATGDPALDIGNFAGHIIEQSLREFGAPDALDDRVDALVDRYCQLAGEELRERISIYTTLTLARHIAICRTFPDRQHILEPLIELCEMRLAHSPLACSDR